MLAIALISLPLIAYQLWRLWPEIAHLTLRSAWAWSVVAFACLAASTVGEITSVGVSAAAKSSLHYLTATMLLAPLMAVLGARRPGANAWPWFVVFPLILVLQWPAVSQLMTSSGREPIDIGTPATLGVLLVLLMGFGNYFGTKNTLAVFLVGGAVLCSLMPVTGWISSDSSLPLMTILPLMTPLLLTAATALVRRRIGQLRNLPQETVSETVDRLWLTFRDYYGIVWAKRVMDRVNQFAVRERWSVHLTLDGLSDVGTNGVSVRHTVPEIKQTVGEYDCVSAHAFPDVMTAGGDADSRFERPIAVLCWILKRFGSDSWLAAMLKDAHPATDSGEEV